MITPMALSVDIIASKLLGWKHHKYIYCWDSPDGSGIETIGDMQYDELFMFMCAVEPSRLDHYEDIKNLDESVRKTIQENLFTPIPSLSKNKDFLFDIIRKLCDIGIVVKSNPNKTYSFVVSEDDSFGNYHEYFLAIEGALIYHQANENNKMKEQ